MSERRSPSPNIGLLLGQDKAMQESPFKGWSLIHRSRQKAKVTLMPRTPWNVVKVIEVTLVEEVRASMMVLQKGERGGLVEEVMRKKHARVWEKTLVTTLRMFPYSLAKS